MASRSFDQADTADETNLSDTFTAQSVTISAQNKSTLTGKERALLKETARIFCTPALTQRTSFELDLIRSAQSIELPSGIKGLIWGAGPRILLVHGWCGRGTQLGAFVQPLTAKGFSVMTIDCWGHGESPGVLSNGVKFAESIVEAETHHGPFHSLIGHSLGGAAILIAVARGISAERAVLMAPPAILNVMRRFASARGLSPDLTEAFVQELEIDAAAPRETVDYRYLIDGFEQAGLPILLMHDEADKEIPVEESELYLADRTNVTFIKTSGLGHLRIIKAPHVVEKAVHFVSS